MGKATNISGNTNFSLNITELTEGTTYYVKAYATNLKGTSYGTEERYTTLVITLPNVILSSITNPTSNSAIGCGNVTFTGNAMVTKRGVCWNINGNPTLQNCLGFTEDGMGTGSFTSIISGLSASTTYYVRAYATNSNGVAYSEDDIGFTTLEPWLGGNSSTLNHIAGMVAQ
ncbi:MAG: hypothetical protein IPF68_13065 [Bacteroidales bacterium]|nr:hypothetical protein [Bacteroidales bacterium]